MRFGAQLKARLSKGSDTMTLRELQLSFSRDIFSGSETGFGKQLRANGLNGDRRLQVYRNNTYLNFTAALQATYPVVQRLVGEGFFRYAAHSYITGYPASSGDLHEFGATFPDFLGRFEPAAAQSYLADVARLEWAYERVYYAADHAALDVGALAKVPTDCYGELRFVLHPASRLLSSAYPILGIWQINQEDYEGDQTIHLDEGGDRLLILRTPQLDVEIQRLAEGEFALLQALAIGHNFAAACELALEAQPDLDVPTCFRHHVMQGTLVHFSYANPSAEEES
jgi:hypothetical protein